MGLSFLTSLTLMAVCVLDSWGISPGNQCPSQEIGSPCSCDHGIFYEVNGTRVECREIKDLQVLLKQIRNFRGYKIDYLLLTQLQLPFLPAGLFSGLSVKRLVIRESILENLYSVKDYKPSPFDGLDSLEEFYVESTRDPSKWYWPSLEHLKSLKRIEFSHAPIDWIGHHFSEIGGGSLEYISAKYSRVYRIHPQAFPELTNLKEVDFSGNYLPYLVRMMFPNPAPQLRKMNFRDNRLFTLNENMFENMPALKYLDLSQNEFRSFHNVVFAPLWNNLRFFYISDNPFKCGCDLLPLKDSLISAIHPEHHDLKDVTCGLPDTSEKSNLKDIDSDHLKCHQ